MRKLNEYLTVGQAAKHLGLSRDTLRRWDRTGRLKARRHPLTGYRLYLLKELDALLSEVGAAPRPGPRPQGRGDTG